MQQYINTAQILLTSTQQMKQYPSHKNQTRQFCAKFKNESIHIHEEEKKVTKCTIIWSINGPA